MMISMIVAMDNNRVIGADNDMPWHLPDDLKHFKENTLGKPVVMGRKTFESIGCRPLPKRRNMVITRNADYQAQGAEVFTSVEAALAALSDVEEVVIMGGGQIYSQMLPQADKLYLTFVNTEVAGDTLFPDWTSGNWHKVCEAHHDKDERHVYDFRFVTLERSNRPE